MNHEEALTRVRPATRDDLPAIAEVFGSLEEHVFGRQSRLDAASVDGWLQSLDYETNTWLVVGSAGEEPLLAAAFGQIHGRRGVFAGAVRPDLHGRGLGSALVDLAEARLAAEGAERIHTWALAGDQAAADLFDGRGYREVRRFWDMGIELEPDLLGAGVEIEGFDEKDAVAFHAALEEAFSDHWEHQPDPFDEWWRRQRQRAAYDPTLWFMICDGAEVAAVIRNEANRQRGGYVAALGVRRPWRGRGYGRALLLHTFGEFRRRGITRASLTVDSANPTGATRLYSSVGMQVVVEHVILERRLGGRAASVQASGV